MHLEVEVDEEKFLIPFDFNGIPIKYEELKEFSRDLQSFLEKVSKEDYETFYNNEVKEVKKKEQERLEEYNNKINEIKEEKAKQEEKYIENFDYNISKPILAEKEIEKILENFTFYSGDFIDIREVKYPLIINFYKDNILLKSMSCSKNLIQSLANVGKTIDYDTYSYSYVPEEYIGQVFEYIVLFKTPLYTSSRSLRNYVVYCPLNILIKRLNKDGDYIFRKDKLLKLLERNKIECFERDGRVIVNVRLALEQIRIFLSGIEKL